MKRFSKISSISLLLLPFLMTSNTFAGEEISPDDPIVKTFSGVWKGDCFNIRPSKSGAKQFIATMERTVAYQSESGSLSWISSYNGGSNVKDYTLVSLDDSAGKYAIDEGAGVLLNAFFAGDTLYQDFGVGNTQFFTVDRIIGDTWLFELSLYPTRPTSTAGGVASYDLKSVQRCLLHRQ